MGISETGATTPERVVPRDSPLSFSTQNGYHHVQSERYEPTPNGLTDSKSHHSPGTISPSKSSNDLRDSFKSSAPSRGSSHRGSFSRGTFQPPATASTRADNQNHDSTMRGRSLSNARSAPDFGDDRQRQQKPYSDDRQPRSDADATTRSQSLQRSATLTDFERPSDKGPFDVGRELGGDSGERSPERDNGRYDRFNRRADERPRIIDNRRNPPDQRYGDNNRQYDNSRSGSVIPTVDRQSDDHASRQLDERSTARSTDYQQPPAQDGGSDRRMPPPPASPVVPDTRLPPSLPPSTHVERTGRSSAADSTPLLPSDATTVRNVVDDHTAQQPALNTKDERKTLEERLSRPPPLSLQERIGMPAGSDTHSISGTPRPTLPLEERLSYPLDRARDDRGSRSGPNSPTVARSSTGSLNQDDRHLSTGAPRPTPDERGRYPSMSEHVDDRKPPVRSSMPLPNASENSRAPSLPRDDYVGRGTDVRDYRRGGAVGSNTREPSEARGPDRFGGVDRMELDRYDDRIPRDPYIRNPSGIPPGPDVRDRERGVWDRPRWPESSRNDPYNDDLQYRQGGPASYPHGHGRYQDGDDRPRWEDKDRQWDQSGPWPDRDRRFIERDSAPASGIANVWETREEREAREQRERNARGRPVYPPPPLSGPDRGYDSRASLTSKISPQRYSPAPVEGRYPPGRDMNPPAIYSQPPIPVSSGPTSVPNSAPGYSSRVRPRSPSPISISRDTSRPPIKRQREDFGPSASGDYYSTHAPGETDQNGLIGSNNNYPPPLSSRMPSGPMSSSSGPPPGYYGHSSGVSANRGPRDYHQGPRDGYPPGPPPPPQGYDRMPPPRGHQNYHQRGNYARDDRRYGGPPPRG